MAYDEDDFTEPQRKIVVETEDAVLRILSDSRARLADTGMDFTPSGEGDFSCTRCSCAAFVSGSTRGHPSLSCKRLGCGHSFTVHRVW
jgi:hypothetical protein